MSQEAPRVIPPKGRRDNVGWIIALGDALALTIAFLVTALVRTTFEGRVGRPRLTELLDPNDPRLLVFPLLALAALLTFWYLGHYGRRRPFWDEVASVVKVVAILALVDLALLFLSRSQVSRIWVLSIWVVIPFLMPAVRAATKQLLLRLGRWQQPTVVIGTGENAIAAAEALEDEPLMGFRVVAFADLETPTESTPRALSLHGREVPLIHLSEVLEQEIEELRRRGVKNITLAPESAVTPAHRAFVNALYPHFPSVSIVPPLQGLPLYGTEVSHFFRHEALFLRIRNNLDRPGAQLLKRLFDILASSLLLAALSPVLAFIAWKVGRSGRPIVFGHTRVGQNGVPFTCYKFRSMVPDAEKVLEELLARDPAARAEWERDFKLKDDPRVTPFGQFLRSSSLDELPQLWNVLKGEMSLVGPRPVVADELERYGEGVGYYLQAKPGVTGLWQISGRSDIDYADRVYLDGWYVKNWSLWYDLVILLKTLRVVLERSGAY